MTTDTTEALAQDRAHNASATGSQAANQPDLIIATYYRKHELADALGVSVRTLDRWEAQRLGPPRFKVGSVTLYPKKGTLEWMKKNTSEPKRVIHPRVKAARAEAEAEAAASE